MQEEVVIKQQRRTLSGVESFEKKIYLLVV